MVAQSGWPCTARPSWKACTPRSLPSSHHRVSFNKALVAALALFAASVDALRPYPRPRSLQLAPPRTSHQLGVAAFYMLSVFSRLEAALLDGSGACANSGSGGSRGAPYAATQGFTVPSSRQLRETIRRPQRVIDKPLLRVGRDRAVSQSLTRVCAPCRRARGQYARAPATVRPIAHTVCFVRRAHAAECLSISERCLLRNWWLKTRVEARASRAARAPCARIS